MATSPHHQFEKLAKDFLFRCRPHPIVAGLFSKELSHWEGRFVPGLIHTDESFEKNFLKFGLAQRQSRFLAEDADENQWTSDKLVQFLGKRGARNILCALGFRWRADPAAFENLDKFAIGNALNFASSFENFFEENRLLHPERAFQAGWICDAVLAGAESLDPKPKMDLALLKKYLEEAIHSAQIVHFLGMTQEDFSFEKDVSVTAVLIGLGRFLMALLFQDGQKTWSDFEKEMIIIRKHLALQAHSILERKYFWITHSECAALLGSFSGLLKGSAKAVLHYENPMFLKNADRPNYQLSALLSVAQVLAQSDRGRVNHVDDLPLNDIQLEAIGEFGIFKKECVKALRAYRSFRF
jgi:hypothetical protein